MSDTPIYDGMNSEPEPDKNGTWITSMAGRRYLYAVASAILAAAAMYLGIDAVMRETWLQLIAAILNIGGAATTVVARKNVR